MTQTFALRAAVSSFAILLAGACAQGQEPAASDPDANAGANPDATPVADADAAAARGEPGLWTLADEDTTVHLFGTVHILRPELEWRTATFDEAFNAADAIFLETDATSAEAQQEVQSAIPALGLYTDGSTLTGVLEDADEKEVREAIEIIGVPIETYDPMKPWLAGVTMQVQFLMKSGYSPGAGVEAVVTELAQDSDKPIRFFETATQQLNFLAGLPEEDQIAFLVGGAEAIEDDPDQLDVLVAEWAEGDVDAIGDLLADPDALGTPMVYDTLLTKRNADWAKQIETLMAEEAGVFFVAVGAGHLAGKDSLQTMLEAKGFDVVRK